VYDYLNFLPPCSEPIPQSREAEAKATIGQLVEAGILVRSNESEWGSPCFFLPKKGNAGLRFHQGANSKEILLDFVDKNGLRGGGDARKPSLKRAEFHTQDHTDWKDGEPPVLFGNLMESPDLL
jgi:hypothetical protein